jgi:transposase-like protein
MEQPNEQMGFSLGPVPGVCPHCQKPGGLVRTGADRTHTYYDCKKCGKPVSYMLAFLSRGGRYGDR